MSFVLTCLHVVGWVCIWAWMWAAVLAVYMGAYQRRGAYPSQLQRRLVVIAGGPLIWVWTAWDSIEEDGES